MTKFKAATKFFTVFIFVTFLSINCFADPNDPNENGTLGDENTPIDGGLSVLIAAGVAYGAKKANDSRKQKLNRKEPLQ